MTPDVNLTDTEHALFGKILLDMDDLRGSYEVAACNGENVATLMESLVRRNGIPAGRLSYFNDPAYRTGRLKGSRKDLFPRNCGTVEEMVCHPGFLQHLRYFVCGPDLPFSALTEFKEAVTSCGQVSPGDALDLGELARKQVRAHDGLSSCDAALEYFKGRDRWRGVGHACADDRKAGRGAALRARPSPMTSHREQS